MAQTEDIELRDLVIETLEKNGSLAKIRALLRANIFLAFEDECENMRHNVSLDNVLKVPEGICALSIVHEFLEFCNLKNTLFVYKSESRQGKDYTCDGKKFILDKLNFNKLEIGKEPILVTLIKNSIKHNYNNYDDNSILKKLQNCGDNIYKDEQNNSYIVHEDSQSSTTSTSQSDNSMDEKNKLHLRLHLDNSDTDTSTDSSRGKSASEYIPSDHIVKEQNSKKTSKDSSNIGDSSLRKELSLPPYFTKVAGNTSSDSTSYVDLQPFSPTDEKMLNTSGLPETEMHIQPKEQVLQKHSEHSKLDFAVSSTASSVSSLSMKNDKQISKTAKNLSQESEKSDEDTGEYSFDFSPSQGSKDKENSLKKKLSDSIKDFINDGSKHSPISSPHQNSHSSVSISDVADLISDKSSSSDHHSNNVKSPKDKSFILSSSNSKKKSVSLLNKLNSDDSGDFTESPIPSLSNLSLDIP